MIFYKYVCETEDEQGEGLDYKQIKKLGFKCNEFNKEKLNDEMLLFLIEKEYRVLEIGVIVKEFLKNQIEPDNQVNELLLYLNLNYLIKSKTEVSLESISTYLDEGCTNGFSRAYREIRERLGIYIQSLECREMSCVENLTKKQVLKKCENLVMNKVFYEEIERIYAPSKEKTFGVPVQYIVNCGDHETAKTASEILTFCLKANKRILRNKVSYIEISPFSSNNGIRNDLSVFLMVNEGGCVIIDCQIDFIDDDKFSYERGVLTTIAQVVQSYSQKVTCILMLHSKNMVKFIKSKLYENIVIEIADENLNFEQSKNMLLKLAQENKITQTDGLIEQIKESENYSMSEIRNIYKKWKELYVRTVQFPQYKDFIAQTVEEEKITTTAYQDFQNLIGLQTVKAVVNNYINYAKLQDACIKQGHKPYSISRHLCFVGNPGTAKTTVARYIAKIMKENNLLSKGDLIEVGRADVVSKYLGGTAPKVQELFKKARGSVLFIDEAYSLYDGKEGMYGDEAINTIVQEMENARDDIVVIFAGYKNEMQRFLDKNSGLKSRIAYHIEFPDYNTDELLDIAKLQADKMDISISCCEDKLKQIFQQGVLEQNFGNGRFVRNVLEKARVKQASRLVNNNLLNSEELNVLKPEDFELEIVKKPTKIQMGFC